MPKTATPKTAVKERDAERTKRALLLAAQKLFSIRGYAEVGVRDIAAEVGINPALVAYYFGSKKGLFAAALDELMRPEYFTSLHRARFGVELVDRISKASSERAEALPMLVYAVSNAEARKIALTLLEEKIAVPLRQSLGDDSAAEERVARIMAVAMGFSIFQHLLPLRSMAGPLAPSTRRWLAHTFQCIIEEAP